MKDIINYNKIGLFHGYQVRYYTTGKLCYRINYNNSMRDGYRECYYYRNIGNRIISLTFYIV